MAVKSKIPVDKLVDRQQQFDAAFADWLRNCSQPATQKDLDDLQKILGSSKKTTYFQPSSRLDDVNQNIWLHNQVLESSRMRQEAENRVKAERVNRVPDKIIRNIGLRDLVALAQCFDLNESDGVEQFCEGVIALEKGATKAAAVPQMRLSAEEKNLADKIRSRKLPRWSERKQKMDELRQLKAPYYFAKVYNSDMGPALTRKVLKAVDPELVGAISNWQRDNGELPEGICLPNERSEARGWVERFNAGQLLPEDHDPTANGRNSSRLRRASSR